MLCRAGPERGEVRGGTVRTRTGRRQAADAAMRRPRVPRRERHWTSGAAAGGC